MENRAVRLEEFDLEEFCKNDKDIIVLIVAGYKKETDTGEYKCLMIYNNNKRIISKEINNAISPNYTMICGLKDATDRITGTGYNIVVISGIHLGFKGALEGKGLYSKELNQIFAKMEDKDNKICNIAITNGADAIKVYIRREELGLK